MIEDDIEFLGVSRPRVLHPSVNSVTGKLQHVMAFCSSITFISSGFTLHVEKNGNEPGIRMMFRKINTNTVVVGRKGPGPSGVYESDDAKAMFRCPVVSRVHAKFTFSESGLVGRALLHLLQSLIHCYLSALSYRHLLPPWHLYPSTVVSNFQDNRF